MWRILSGNRQNRKTIDRRMWIHTNQTPFTDNLNIMTAARCIFHPHHLSSLFGWPYSYSLKDAFPLCPLRLPFFLILIQDGAHWLQTQCPLARNLQHSKLNSPYFRCSTEWCEILPVLKIFGKVDTIFRNSSILTAYKIGLPNELAIFITERATAMCKFHSKDIWW